MANPERFGMSESDWAGKGTSSMADMRAAMARLREISHTLDCQCPPCVARSGAISQGMQRLQDARESGAIADVADIIDTLGVVSPSAAQALIESFARESR